MTRQEIELALSERLDQLQGRLLDASNSRLCDSLISQDSLRDAVGDQEYRMIIARTDRHALTRQIDAVAEFILEVILMWVGEGESDLLSSVSDEMDGLGELSHLRALRAVLQSGRNAGTESDVLTCLVECLTPCPHDSSPNGEAVDCHPRI